MLKYNSNLYQIWEQFDLFEALTKPSSLPVILKKIVSFVTSFNALAK